MNFVVIDSDSKLRSQFKNEEELKKLLGDTKCKVYYLENSKLSKSEYKLSSAFDVHEFDRLIFITSFPSGIMSYHRKLFINNSEFKKLTITIVNTEDEVYQEQIVNELDSILADEKVLYNILLDSCDTMSLTAKECKKKVNTQKLLTVVSKKRNLAKMTAEIFGKLLSKWQVNFTDNPDDEIYDDSNLVLLVGEQTEDFNFKAPKSGMGKYLVWYNVNKLGYDDAYLSDIKYSIKECLLDLGWNIHYNCDIYLSNIIYEDISVNILTKTCSISSLVGNKNFVMWDRFGLPLTNSQQDDSEILGFINRICCFETILKRAN